MAIRFFDDIFKKSCIRLGRICGWPAVISAAIAAKPSICAHLLGRKACRPEEEYFTVRLLASLAKSFAT